MKAKLFSIPLYSPQLYVVVGELKGDELYKHVHKKFGISIPKLLTEVDGCEGCCNRQEDFIVLWVRSLEGALAMGILAHECLHATAEVMRFSGLSFNDGSEEAYTYLLGWMVESILKWRAV